MNKKKGFTLIELLVTILIIAVTFTIAGFAIVGLIDTSEKQSKTISIKSVKSSANQYVSEEKGADKYWFGSNEDSNIEYACTTVGILINKGYLKEDVTNLEFEDKKIDKDTSIRVERDKTTKVSKDEILFNDSECNETSTINISFEVSGSHNVGYDDWYNSDVTIKINADNTSQIGEYTYLVNGETGSVSEENAKDTNWKIKVGKEGKDIDVCVNVTSLRDKESTFCLSDENKKYNMDKTKPSVPIITLTENNGYQITSSGSTDNVTTSDKLLYYITEDSVEMVSKNPESGSYINPVDTRTNLSIISSYVIDEAGNKSNVSERELVIKSSENRTSEKKYICSLYQNNYYNTESEAKAVCSTTGTVSNETTYYCYSNPSLSSVNYSYVANNCYEYGVITQSGGGSQRINYAVDGYSNITYRCATGAWTVIDTDSSDYGCNNGIYDGYFISYTCTPNGIGTQSCSPNNSTTYLPRSCTNYCYTYVDIPVTYYCSLGYIVSSYSSPCYTSGTVGSYTNYYCSLNNLSYGDYQSALNNCSSQGSISNKYYCNLTNRYYNSENEAITACSNYCSSGTYYSNACYTFK